MTDPRTGIATRALFASVLLLTALAYWPGLSGPFLFDDFANLPALGDFNGVRNWETFWLYFAGGIGGPTGRPLALASFLLNATNWPADPWGFKATNLLLHLLCGVVLWALLRRALPFTGIEPPAANRMALLTAALWLLHPLNVSTVLYVVQRMTILSALFVLLGLWGYLHGRLLSAKDPLKGTLLATGALVTGTALATLSKENGLLLPTLALVMEATLLQAPKSPLSTAPIGLRLLLWLPTAAILGYLVDVGLAATYGSRPYTPSERLLTQSRILFDYLAHWFVPKVASPGLFGGEFPLSKGLLTPPTTLAALIGIGALLGVGLFARRRAPWVSAAILFFLGGHLLESTSIGLELYFEHRNYLPTMLLGLPLATLGRRLVPTPAIRAVIALALVLWLAGITFLRASLWGDELALHLSWAEQHPDSSRAQTAAALAAARAGRLDMAVGLLEGAISRNPRNLTLRLHWLEYTCRMRALEPTEIEENLELMRTVPYHFRPLPLVESVILFFASGDCRGLTIPDVHTMLDALFENPSSRASKGPERLLYHIRGQIYLQENKPELALAAFRKSLEAIPDPEAALVQAAKLAAHGSYPEAAAILDLAATMNTEKSANLFNRRDYAGEIARLRGMVEEEMANTPAASIPRPEN